MKKRSFLVPLALSVATLVGAEASAATTANLPITPVVESVATKVAEKDFVLAPSKDSARAQQFAGHYSHSSHSSHASHSSHFSSRY